MPRRYFNWKLAIVLLISVAVLGVSAVGLRKWRNANSAEKGLDLGNKAYNEKNWKEAAKQLGRYIVVNQNDVDALLKYADSQLKIRPATSNNILQAVQAYRAVLRLDPGNLKAAKQATELYFLMGQDEVVESITSRFIETSPDPEITRIHAIALVHQRKFHEAADELKKLCAASPNHVPAYETAGQLAEQHPEEFTEPAAYWYNEAVKNNPTSALAYVNRAGFYIRNKDTNSALADLKIAEQHDLSNSAVCLKLAGGYITLNLLDKAEQVLAKSQKISPADQNIWQLSAQVALMTQSAEKMKAAAQTGLKELSSEPWDFMPLAAELFIRSGELSQAEDCIQRLNQNGFEKSKISYLEGLMYAQKKDYLNAIKSWKNSIESGNNTTKVRLELSIALFNSGDIQSAINQLRALVSEKPDSFDGHLALAKILAQTANWAEAQEHAVKASELEPDNSEARLLQIQTQLQITGTDASNKQGSQDVEALLSKMNSAGAPAIEVDFLRLQVEMRKGNYAKALELINKIKQENPSQVRIDLAEAELFAIQDKLDEATKILRQSIQKYPDASSPVIYLAALLDKQGNQQDCAAVIMESVQRINEQLVQRDLILLLVEYYARWGQKDKAYEQLNMIASKLPNDIQIKRRLLQCEQVMGNPQMAQKLVDEIKSLEGDSGWQWRYEQARLDYLSDGFKERYTQIVSLMKENLTANPKDQASRLLLARAYEKAGEMQLAAATYREVLSRSPDNMQILTILISALYKMKEYDQADELLKRVSPQSLQNPQLQRLQLQNLLRQGQIDSASDILHGLVGEDPNNQNANLALALLQLQQGKYAESEQILKKLYSKDPNSLSVAAAQIQLYLKLEKPQEALKICDEAVSRLKNVSAYVLRARTYASLKQSEKAIEDLDKAVSTEPENAQVWMARSDFYRSININDKALGDIRKAMSLDQKNVQIQKRAITLLVTSNKLDSISEGKNIIDQSLKSNPDDVELLFYKANSLFLEGTAPAIENARQILQKITKDSPEFSKAWLLLGEMMIKKSQAGTAMDYASQGLAYTPNNEALLFLKARAEAMRSPVLAVPTLKVLCDLNPNNIEAVSFLANTYITSGEPDKAVSFLQNIISKCDSSNTKTYNISMAAAMYKAKNKAEAIKKLDSLIDTSPDDPAPFLAKIFLLKDDQLWDELKSQTLGWYQKHPGNSRVPAVIANSLISVNSDEARKVSEEIFNTILKNDPKNTESLQSLAILLGIAERFEESAGTYKKLLELQPDNVVAINNLAWLMCENLEQPQQALELAQKGLALNSSYADLIDTRGMIYFRLGQYQKAVLDFSKCVELYPDFTPQAAASRFHLAKACAGLKQNVKAIGYLKEAIDLVNKSGGLNSKELSEAQSLLKQLQENI